MNRAALPLDHVPETMAGLAVAKGIAALAVRFVFLTAGRASEVANARWAEIDRTTATWTIPAGRMKTGRTHRVPLSTAALAVLDEARTKIRDEFVFPSPVQGQGVSKTALVAALRRLTEDRSTVHGARTCFRGWCTAVGIDPAAAEAALAHVRGTPTSRAYDRDDLFEARQGVMERWGVFATGAPAEQVVELASRRAR